MGYVPVMCGSDLILNTIPGGGGYSSIPVNAGAGGGSSPVPAAAESPAQQGAHARSRCLRMLLATQVVWITGQASATDRHCQSQRRVEMVGPCPSPTAPTLAWALGTLPSASELPACLLLPCTRAGSLPGPQGRCSTFAQGEAAHKPQTNRRCDLRPLMA